MSEDAFEPSFPSYDYGEEFPYGSPLDDEDEDDTPLNLELGSVSSAGRANRRRGREWNGVLSMDQDDEPLLDVNNIEDDDQLLDLEMSLREHGKANLFARFYAAFPWIVLLVALLMAGVAAVVSYKFYKLTDMLNFDDPTAGFEARNTDTSAKSKTAQALLYSMTSNSTDIYSPFPNISSLPFLRRRKRSAADGYESYAACDEKNLSPFASADSVEDVMQFVFESTDGRSLFTAEAMHSICRLEDRLVRDYPPSFYSPDGPPCRQLSLPFYVTLLSKKNSCYDINNDDMQQMSEYLLQCWPKIPQVCISTTPRVKNMSEEERTCNAAHNIFCFLTDTGFVHNNTRGPDGAATLGKLKYAMLLLSQRTALVNTDIADTYFEDFLDKKDTSSGSVKLAGFFYNEDVKFDLFDDYLMGDLWLFGLAMGIILFIMFLYLFSVTLMLATLLNVGMSFITAYCLYHLIFGIDFFPFINLLAGLILIAIGADDVFIFCDTWDQVKREDDSMPLDVMVAKTFNHAALSIFVTSLTTSAAFFANSVSSITAIKCFGIFAGTAVLANFLFMITWTPAIIIIMEKYRYKNLDTLLVGIGSTLVVPCLVLTRVVDFGLEYLCGFCSLKQWFGKVTNNIFGKFLPKLIEKLWAVWLVLFLAVGAAGIVVVFYAPKLKLPHSKEIQLFPDSQVIEHWGQKLRNQFRYIQEADMRKLEKIEIQFVWGVKAEDNGGTYDTRASTTLVQDTSFNITAPDSQKWMRDFCNDLVKQPFMNHDLQAHNASRRCFFNHLESMRSFSCNQFAHLLNTSLSRYAMCCQDKRTEIPMNAADLELCLPLAIVSFLQDGLSFNPYTSFLLGGLSFNPYTNLPSAFYMRVPTEVAFSTSYEEMKDHKKTFDSYFAKWLASAPPGLQTGWVTSQYYSFYDLQDSIANGTYYSIILSLSVAFGVMLLTSLNALITIYALLTISLAIATTIGSLVLMGWELNIIESVTISLAVGLSIDFTIHYGVAYRLSTEKYPKARVRESFARVGSAVLMAALTTFLAGAAIMPSRIVAYRELGIFLMLVMTFSWFYATFFFQSLCRLVGPKGNFCQIPLPCGKKKRTTLDTELENHTSRSSLMLRSDSEDSLLVTF